MSRQRENQQEERYQGNTSGSEGKRNKRRKITIIKKGTNEDERNMYVDAHMW